MHPKVIRAETCKPFLLEFKNEFYEGDFDKILTEADKCRLIHSIIEKIVIDDCSNTLKALDEKEYPRIVGKEQTLNQFLQRNDLICEFFPLSGKARVIRAAREGHNDPSKSNLLDSIKKLSIFVDVESIRVHYGEEVAIYF